MADKGRFICDGLKQQRLLQPMMRNEEGILRWSEFIEPIYINLAKIINFLILSVFRPLKIHCKITYPHSFIFEK